MKKELKTGGRAACIGLVMAFASAVFGENIYWDPNGSGNWNSSTRWVGGMTYKAGMTVRGSASAVGDNAILVTDEDVDNFKAVGGIVLEHTAELVINTSSDIKMEKTIWGEGTVYKKGSGTFTAYTGPDATTPIFCNAKLEVDEGTMRYENLSAAVYRNYNCVVDVKSGANVDLSSCVAIMGLNGEGAIKVTDGVSTQVILKVSGSTTVTNDFAGTFSGQIYYESRGGCQILRDNACEPTGGFNLYGGYLGLSKMPQSGGTMAVRNPGVVVEYVGTSDFSDGNAQVWLNNQTYDFVLSGGSYGGLTTQRRIMFNPSDLAMGWIAFGGDNANRCTFNGNLSDCYDARAFYLKKTGTGTWRFTKDKEANRLNKGTVAVENGVLEYESIAERGYACSLGLATMCHSEYEGVAADPKKAVGYAYLIGNGTDTSTAEMKYVGSTDATVTTRPVAINGKGRFSSESAKLDWNGFTCANDGINTLTLGGTTDCIARGVTNGVGTLAVEKEGTGSWTLQDDFDFTGGVAANGGTLKLNTDQDYHWYRFTMMQNWRGATNENGEAISGDGGHMCIRQFSLFDEDGNDLVENFEHNTTADGNTTALQPGEAALTSANYAFLSYNWGLTNLFTTTDNGFAANVNGGVAKLEEPTKWVSVVMHLRNGHAAAKYYDMRAHGYYPRKDYFVRDVRSWKVEASVDGETWNLVHSVISNDLSKATTTEFCRWYSNNTKTHTAESMGYAMRTFVRTSSLGYVGVANGGSLVTDKAISVDALKYDGTTGGGTISGFAIADNPVIIAENPGDTSTGVKFENTTGLEKLSSAPVMLNGSVTTRYSLVNRDGRYYLARRGMVISIR